MVKPMEEGFVTQLIHSIQSRYINTCSISIAKLTINLTLIGRFYRSVGDSMNSGPEVQSHNLE